MVGSMGESRIGSMVESRSESMIVSRAASRVASRVASRIGSIKESLDASMNTAHRIGIRARKLWIHAYHFIPLPL